MRLLIVQVFCFFLTYNRLSGLLQVLAACIYPELVNSNRLPADVRQRAQRILGECVGGSVGMVLLCDIHNYFNQF